MSTQVNLPDELAAQIDVVASDRTAFVAEAVRRALREANRESATGELEAINAVADELNSEAEDVLAFADRG